MAVLGRSRSGPPPPDQILDPPLVIMMYRSLVPNRQGTNPILGIITNLGKVAVVCVPILSVGRRALEITANEDTEIQNYRYLT